MSAAETQSVGEIRSQLDIIVRNLRSDLQVWDQCHATGLSLVNDLAKLHGKCLTITRILKKDITRRRLRLEQQRLRLSRTECKKSQERLLFLVDRLLDATEHSRESLGKLRQMYSKTAMVGQIIYRTWELRDILEFVESIMLLYDSEYEIKEMVAEELINCKDHEELQLIRQAWRSPRHALTTEFKHLFKQFNFETFEVKPQ